MAFSAPDGFASRRKREAGALIEDEERAARQNMELQSRHPELPDGFVEV